MMDVFSLIFFVGLAKYLWDENKSNMFISLLNSVIASKFSAPSSPGGVSRAVKQLNGSYHVDYTVNGATHTVVIPPQRRKTKWDRAVATLETGETVDVTILVRPYAGPHGNFLGFDYHPSHLHRGASTIELFHEETLVRKFGQ